MKLKAAFFLPAGAAIAVATASPAKAGMDGIYIGAFGGGTTIQSESPIGSTENSSPMGGIGGIRAGYGFHPITGAGLYTGLEVEAIGSLNALTDKTPHNHVHGGGTHTRLNYNGQIGAHARLGWSFGNSLLFLRTGLAAPNYELKRTNIATKDFWMGNIEVGAGAEVAVTPKIAIRLDGVYAPERGYNSVERYRGTVGVSYRF